MRALPDSIVRAPPTDSRLRRVPRRGHHPTGASSVEEALKISSPSSAATASLRRSLRGRRGERRPNMWGSPCSPGCRGRRTQGERPGLTPIPRRSPRSRAWPRGSRCRPSRFPSTLPRSRTIVIMSTSCWPRSTFLRTSARDWPPSTVLRALSPAVRGGAMRPAALRLLGQGGERRLPLLRRGDDLDAPVHERERDVRRGERRQLPLGVRPAGLRARSGRLRHRHLVARLPPAARLGRAGPLSRRSDLPGGRMRPPGVLARGRPALQAGRQPPAAALRERHLAGRGGLRLERGVLRRGRGVPRVRLRRAAVRRRERVGPGVRRMRVATAGAVRGAELLLERHVRAAAGLPPRPELLPARQRVPRDVRPVEVPGPFE